MSKYTTELRFICEKAAGLENSTGYNDVNNVIQKAIPNIFSFDFPIFDETYRNVICTKILMHYYTREICEEVVGLWKLRLQTKMNEIMPYYNQLYKSELLTFNPLNDTDIETTNTASKKENSGSSNTTNGKTLDLFSDTPQGGLDGVESEKYLSSARKVINNDTSENKYNATTTDEYVNRVTGKSGSITYSTMLKEFRETFMNIDMQIIGELEPLFFGLW